MTSPALKTAVFPIAGLGTRFLPATKAISKEMLPVVDRPLIDYAVEEALAAGLSRFVFVIPPMTGDLLVKKHFGKNSALESLLRGQGKMDALQAVQNCTLDPDCVAYAIQDKPLGLGHAVLCARPHVDEDEFAVILPDDLILAEHHCMHQMVQAHRQRRGTMLAIEQVRAEYVNRYGIVTPRAISDSLIDVAGVVEKPAPEAAPSNYASIGRYILTREVFDILAYQAPGVGGEIQLTDAINVLASQDQVRGVIFAGTRYDCGSKAGYVAANIAYAFQDRNLRATVESLLGPLG